jgi:3-dehydroquinate synthase
MADASVGGKTGVDFNGLKNHIGTFAQPKGVFVFPGFLHSLPKRDLMSGFAEVLKAGLICDSDFFSSITRLRNLQIHKSVEILYRSISIKNKIVKKDPEEKNIRKALNFGHTVGHALETASLSTDQPLLHGEAVALGMLAEARISCDMQYISSVELKKISNGLSRFYKGLKPVSCDPNLLIDLMRQDKKNRDGNINFVLLNKIGKYRIDCVVPEALILKSLHELSL